MTERNSDIIHVPTGTRLMRLDRIPGGWRLWMATADYKLGTYLRLHSNGMVENVTARCDEGDEAFVVRPPD